MLNEFQQKLIWDGWLSAEIRAAYFAELARRYQVTQRWLTGGALLLSSGATIALLTTVVPARVWWIKPGLTFLSAALSAWTLVAKYERNSIDSADLHSRWQGLAVGYQTLWSDISAEGAAATLRGLQEREIEVSKSSTSMPDDQGLMEKCQDHVVLHHQAAY